MATMGAGSAFMHGSHTKVGHRLDTKPIVLIAFQAHQMMLENMPGMTQEMWNLQAEARTETITQSVDKMIRTLIDDDVPTWRQTLENLDMPSSYDLIFGAIIANILVMIYPWWFVEWCVTSLAENIIPKKKDYLLDYYLPGLEGAASQIEVPLFYKVMIFFKMQGVLVKMMYAFLF